MVKRGAGFNFEWTSWSLNDLQMHFTNTAKANFAASLQLPTLHFSLQRGQPQSRHFPTFGWFPGTSPIPTPTPGPSACGWWGAAEVLPGFCCLLLMLFDIWASLSASLSGCRRRPGSGSCWWQLLRHYRNLGALAFQSFASKPGWLETDVAIISDL